MNKSTFNTLSYKNKALTLGASFLAVTSVFALANGAKAATFNFSFTNETGAVNGTVSGTVELPDGDGTFAATTVTITSAPAGLGLTLPINNFPSGIIENEFSVVGGQINLAGTRFVGLINPNTALSFNSAFSGGATFLDALDASDFGVSGVLDSDSSTLTFSSASSVTTPEPATILGLLAVGSLAGLTRKRQA